MSTGSTANKGPGSDTVSTPCNNENQSQEVSASVPGVKDNASVPGEDAFFTPDIVDALCYSDSSDMRTSLLEEILNQKKQELLKSPEVTQWLSKKEKEKSEHQDSTDQEVSSGIMETNNSNSDHVVKPSIESKKKGAETLSSNDNKIASSQRQFTTSHIAVHPSVYTMNRQTGAAKTQTKMSQQ